MISRYILTERVRKRLVGERNLDLTCPKCGKSVQVNDRVVSVVRARKSYGRTKLYHESCWDGMFYD